MPPAQNPIAQNTIGRTRLAVSELGLGGTSLGNMYAAVADRTASDLVFASETAGITLFDTAPCYGVGLSELRLGEVLPATARVFRAVDKGRLRARAAGGR